VRWQRVEQIRQHFWSRWSNEYLHSLQERSKWKYTKGTQLAPGQLVLIKQENLAPMQWTLGRVQEVRPGSDGHSRAATVKTEGLACEAVIEACNITYRHLRLR